MEIDDYYRYMRSTSPIAARIRSTERNRGFGLSNILNGSTSARIFSGSALVVKQNENTTIVSTNFSFSGTLIYFEVDLSKTEEEEVINDFEW